VGGGDKMTTTKSILEYATELFTLLKTSMGIFAEPPLAYFTGMALLGTGVAMAWRFIPKKRG